MALACVAVLSVACGGSSNVVGSSNQTATSGAGSTSAASATAPSKVLTALALLPDLKDKGLVRQESEKLAAPANVDVAYAVYDGTGTVPVSARAQVMVYPTAEDAAGDFRAQADGWRKPPPAVFGTDLANVDSAAMPGFQDSVGYVSGNADKAGNHVWTDVYRVGRVIVVVHALGKDAATTAPVRNTLAVSIKGEVE